MNLITSNQLTMSTREIAAMLGKNNSDIKRSALRLEQKGLLTQPLAEFDYDHKGNIYTEYKLNKRDSILLVAQNSPEFTAAIVDRWQELENQLVKPQLPDFTNPVEAARAWADEAEAKQIAQALVEKQSAYIERQGKFIDVLEKQHAKGFTPPMFAREMNGVNCHQVQNYLADKKNWMRKTKDGWVATSYARDKYLSVTFKTGTDGVDRPLCELTKEGAAAMYRIYCKGELPMKKSWNGDFTPSKYLPILSDEVTA